MKKIVVAVLLLVVVIAAAIAVVPLAERRAAGQIKAEIERDGQAKVGSVEVGLFGRKVILNDLDVRRVGQIKVRRWEASGLAWPLGELLKGRAPFAGLQLGDPIQAAHLEMHDFTMVQDKGRWSIASVSIDDLRLDRYEPILGPDQFVHIAARVAGALSVGRLEQKGEVFSDLTNGVSVTIPSLTIEGFDKGLIRSVAMSDLTFAAKANAAPAFRMTDFKLTDLDLRRAVAAVSAASWRPGLPFGRIDIGSSDMSGFSGEVLTRYGVSLGRITSQSQLASKDARQSKLRIEGVVIDPPAANLQALQLRLVLQSMGLKQLKLDSDCAGTEDRAKGELAIDRCAVTGADLGELNFAFRLVQADDAFWKAVDNGNTFAMLGTKAAFSDAKMVLVDRGLVERSVNAVAATSGQPPAAVRAQLAEEVRRFQPPGILITEDLGKLLDAVARFVQNGGTLTLDAKPPSPLGLDRLMTLRQPGSDLVNLLGLSATLAR